MGCFFFFFQAEDGIRDLVRSRGLGDVYKRQVQYKGITMRVYWVRMKGQANWKMLVSTDQKLSFTSAMQHYQVRWSIDCLLYTSDAADERSSVDLGGSRIIKKNNKQKKKKRCCDE